MHLAWLRYLAVSWKLSLFRSIKTINKDMVMGICISFSMSMSYRLKSIKEPKKNLKRKKCDNTDFHDNNILRPSRALENKNINNLSQYNMIIKKYPSFTDNQDNQIIQNFIYWWWLFCSGAKDSFATAHSAASTISLRAKHHNKRHKIMDELIKNTL